MHLLISFVHSFIECSHFLKGQEQCSCVMSDASLYAVNMFTTIVNKEADLANGKVDYNYTGIPNRDTNKWKASLGDVM